MQVPNASSQLGAALCLGSICGCDGDPGMGKTFGKRTADMGLAVSMSSAGRDLLEENLGLLQTKLNQSLWNTKSVAGALVCDVWSSLLINFDDRLRDWRVRGRLMECLLRLLNLPAEDTHWRVKVAALRVRAWVHGGCRSVFLCPQQLTVPFSLFGLRCWLETTLSRQHMCGCADAGVVLQLPSCEGNHPVGSICPPISAGTPSTQPGWRRSQSCSAVQTIPVGDS